MITDKLASYGAAKRKIEVVPVGWVPLLKGT